MVSVQIRRRRQRPGFFNRTFFVGFGSDSGVGSGMGSLTGWFPVHFSSDL
jgi:hypothetical protein